MATKQMQDAYSSLLKDSEVLLKKVKVQTMTAKKAMDKENWNGMNNAIVEMSILNQRLGDRVSMAEFIARDAENHYKTVREGHKVRLVKEGEERIATKVDPKTKKKKQVKELVPMAAGVADSAKMKLSEAEFNFWNETLYLAENLKYMLRSANKTIDALRSKLSFVKEDLRQAS